MKKLKSLLLLLILTWTGTSTFSAQSPVSGKSNEGSVFWEVSGNGLTEPSYLFGTYHLLGSSYVDSLKVVMQKFNQSKAFAGELKIDSTIIPKMSEAAALKGTTLDKILLKDDYALTAQWLKELSGYDLSMFNTVNPMTVSIVLLAFVQQQVFPQNPSSPELIMDEYFQQLAKKSGKQITGLETVEDQINAIYLQFSYDRQAELLMDQVKQKDKVGQDLLHMTTIYKKSDFEAIMKIMYGGSFTKTEAEVILDNRNLNWMKQLPALMQQSSVFVAVGALHLSGTNGLVQLLRNDGYTVKPLNP